jgi:hypothetical protein
LAGLWKKAVRSVPPCGRELLETGEQDDGKSEVYSAARAEMVVVVVGTGKKPELEPLCLGNRPNAKVQKSKEPCLRQVSFLRCVFPGRRQCNGDQYVTPESKWLDQARTELEAAGASL